MVTTSKKTLKYNRIAKQAGMTLIELTVVLLILVGLAGLLVPYVGSFNQTTHDSTNSANLSETNNAFGRYVVEKNRLVPHMDLLTNTTAATAAATGSCVGAVIDTLYCGLANSVDGTADASAGVLKVIDYSDAAADAIARQSIVSSGLNMAVGNNPDAGNKTFGTSTGMFMLNTTAAAGWATAKFAAVGAGGFSVGGMPSTTAQEKHLAAALGRDAMAYDSACYDYIAMGLGDNNELVQSTTVAAPVFYPQDGKYGPTQRYGHLLAIIQVDKDNTTAGCSEVTEKAKFLGVVANVPVAESKTLVGVNSLVSQAYSNRATSGN